MTACVYDLTGDVSPCDPMTHLGGADLSPDGSLVVFSSPSTGGGDIYLMGRAGADRVRLTSSSASECYPSFSPDGRQIVFIAEEDKDQNGELFLMEADGSNPQRMTDNGGREWSPIFFQDGSKILFERRRQPCGGWEKFVGEDKCKRERYSMVVLDVETLKERTLIEGEGQRLLRPIGVTPSGESIFYSYADKESKYVDLWSVDLSGSDPSLRSPAVWSIGRDNVFSGMTFSPDEGTIAFGRYGDIYVYRLADGSVEQLTNTPLDEGFPRFVLGGSQILFIEVVDSYDRAKGTIKIMNSDGSNVSTIGLNYETCQPTLLGTCDSTAGSLPKL